MNINKENNNQLYILSVYQRPNSYNQNSYEADTLIIIIEEKSAVTVLVVETDPLTDNYMRKGNIK